MVIETIVGCLTLVVVSSLTFTAYCVRQAPTVVDATDFELRYLKEKRARAMRHSIDPGYFGTRSEATEIVDRCDREIAKLERKK